MKEDLLQFIWRYRLLKPVELHTISSDPVEIIKCGELNNHAGPDFTEARVKIGGTEWAGSIEIHKVSGDWFLHQHHTDKAYDNVILHVVFEYDKPVYNSKGQRIPCLELKNFLSEDIPGKYEILYQSKQQIPCGSLFMEVPAITREAWLNRLLVERMEEKTAFIKELFTFTGNNWEEVFYLLLFKNFGFKVNGDAFLQIAKSIPLSVLLKHSDSLLQTEALLYGQGGLLPANLKDGYPKALVKEYEFLKHKYDLTPIPHKLKFLRLRPQNFPTLRIAQLAHFILKYQHCFSKIRESNSVKEVMSLFETGVSDYWKSHYVFDEESDRKEKKLGRASIENILINSVCPLLFFYGKEKGEERFTERAIAWYEAIKPEKNSITGYFSDLGYIPQCAAHSQGLIQLYQAYCAPKKCLQCSIGASILNKN